MSCSAVFFKPLFRCSFWNQEHISLPGTFLHLLRSLEISHVSCTIITNTKGKKREKIWYIFVHISFYIKKRKERKGKKHAPAANRTRVCTVAGYYSTTRPLVLFLSVVGYNFKIVLTSSSSQFPLSDLSVADWIAWGVSVLRWLHSFDDQVWMNKLELSAVICELYKFVVCTTL